MAKRKVSARPAERTVSRPWNLKPASANARREWEESKTREPDLVEKVRERLTTRPLDRSDNPRRTHQLKGSLGVKWVGDQKLPVWQHEFSGGGRVWYCPDRDAHVVWLVKMALSHPKQTN